MALLKPAPRALRGRELLLAAVLLAFPSVLLAQDREYQVKAAFLFNFVQFVKWPAGAFSSPDAPLVIGILGDDPFGGALDEMVRGESVDNHRLAVRHGQSLADLDGCQMIFVSKSEEGSLGDILSSIGTRPELTVSDIAHFAESGGAIGFFLADGKVRFEINPDAARHGGLRPSSQLLSLGRIVGRKE